MVSILFPGEVLKSSMRKSGKRSVLKKLHAERWLEIHETAHNLGIPSNATMLYGHIENYTHRIDHMTQTPGTPGQDRRLQRFYSPEV